MKKANPTLIGMFVLGGFALAAAAVIAVGGGRVFAPKQHAVIYFDGSVNGLTVGSPVNFRGVRIGEVDRILLQFQADTLNAHIPVYISLVPDSVQVLGVSRGIIDVPFENFIAKGMRAKLAIQSLVTGQLSVDLDFLPDVPGTLMGDGSDSVPEIPAAKSDFDVLKGQLAKVPLSETVNELRGTLAAVSDLAVTANATLKTVGDEFAASASSARKTTETLAVATARLQSDTSATLQSVQRLSDHLDTEVQTLSPQMRETLTTAKQALADADATLAHVSEVSAPGAPLRADLEGAVRDLAIAAESLRSFAETVDRNPQALITGKRKP